MLTRTNGGLLAKRIATVKGSIFRTSFETNYNISVIIIITTSSQARSKDKENTSASATAPPIAPDTAVLPLNLSFTEGEESEW